MTFEINVHRKVNVVEWNDSAIQSSGEPSFFQFPDDCGEPHGVYLLSAVRQVEFIHHLLSRLANLQFICVEFIHESTTLFTKCCLSYVDFICKTFFNLTFLQRSYFVHQILSFLTATVFTKFQRLLTKSCFYLIFFNEIQFLLQ